MNMSIETTSLYKPIAPRDLPALPKSDGTSSILPLLGGEDIEIFGIRFLLGLKVNRKRFFFESKGGLVCCSKMILTWCKDLE